MAVLNYLIQTEIDKLEDLAYEKLQKNDIEESFILREQAWTLYPDPKDNWNEAYNSAKYGFLASKQIKDHERTKNWLNRMINVNNNLHLSNEECSFYIAEYHFDNHDYEEALKRFKEVVKSAGLRYFDGEDSKYLDFYRNPNKYF